MNLVALTVLFFSIQEGPSLLPIPTFPVTFDTAARLPSSWKDGSCSLDSEETLLWRSVRPGWANLDAILFDEGRNWGLLASFLADRNGWTPELAAEAAAALRPQPVMLQYSLSSGDATVLAGLEPMQPGQPRIFGSFESRTVVLDFDVEIAQQASIADPIGGLQYAGITLAVSLLPVPGVGWEAEVVITGANFLGDQPLDLGCNEMAGVSRIPTNLFEFQATVLLLPEFPVEIVLPSLPESSDLEIPIRLSLHGHGRVPAAVTRVGAVQIVLAPGLSAAGQLAKVAENLRSHGDTWHTQSGIFAFGGPAADSLAQEAVAAASSASQSLTTALSLREEAGDGSVSEMGILGDFIARRVLRFAFGNQAQFVRDWDVEVAQESRIPDPLFDFLFHGISGSFVPYADRVQLNLNFQSDELKAAHALRLADQVAVANTEDGAVSRMPAVRANVDQVLSRRTRLDGSFSLSEDGSLSLERQGLKKMRVVVHCGGR